MPVVGDFRAHAVTAIVPEGLAAEALLLADRRELCCGRRRWLQTSDSRPRKGNIQISPVE
jgi:hypothetical protein